MRSAALVVFAVNLAQVAGSFLLPSQRFRCPHCGNRGAFWKKCKACGIRVGTPKAAVVEAEKQRVAGLAAEQAAEAAGYRVADGQVAEAAAADDELDATNAPRHAHGRR
jgi:hypothetical protein